MATYNLPNGPQGNLAAGDIINCSSGAQSITLPPGSYKLECWGAQGGGKVNTGYQGGRGGHSYGIITLSSITTVYTYAGGQGNGGTTAKTLAGGFNGGGDGYGYYVSSSSTYIYGSGGGASDVRIGTDSLYARVIVAGGGGGCGSYNASHIYAGGYGGGETGATGSQYSTQYCAGTGGSQTAPGISYSQYNPNPDTTDRTIAVFGIGGGVSSGYTSRTAGGGGGWYGGGFSARASAGGGSGYVYTSSTASNYPSGCLLNSSYYLADAGTQGGNQSFKSPTNANETGHANNGYVRITVISIIEQKYPIYVKVSGAYNQVKDIYVKANGIWNEAQLYIKNDGIWTKILRDLPYNAKIEYLTFVALQSGTFSFSKAGLSYSLDNGATWTALAAGESTPTITAGKTVMWKNNRTLTSSSSEGIGTFSSTGNFDVKGNIMSLYYRDDFSGQTDLSDKSYAFRKLFMNCNKLYNAENLLLPATTLILSCYSSMFNGCTGLITAPELPAMHLVNSCYSYMFYGCTGLTTAPKLPATTLANNCYTNMFNGCTSLTTAPELPATTLVSNCYGSMFYNCTNLCQVKAAFTTTPSTTYTQNWLSGVASTGTFYKNSTATWTTTGVHAVPTGWTVATFVETIALLHFNIISNSNHVDEVGNTWTITGTVFPLDDNGKWQKALALYESTYSTQRTRNMYISLPSEDFTIDFWAAACTSSQGTYNTSYQNWRSSIALYDGISYSIRLGNGNSSSEWYFSSKSNTNTYTNRSTAFSHHAIEYSFTNKQVRYYYNGVLKCTNTYEFSNPNNVKLYIGEPNQNVYPAQTKIDELRVCKGCIYGGNNFTVPTEQYIY